MTTPTNHPTDPAGDTGHLDDRDDVDCYDCAGVLPGVLTDMDFPGGIQRCDECGTFDGDLEAAHAAAELVGGTVWCMAESDQNPAPDEGVRTRWHGQPDVILVAGNNPWVELDGVLVIWAYTRLLLNAPRDVIRAANKLAPAWKGSSDDLVGAVRAAQTVA